MSKRPRKPRPEKPPHIEASPRFRGKNGGKEKTSALKAVRDLIDANLDWTHIAEREKQVRDEANPRGAAILAVINTEIALRYALARRLATSYGNAEIFGLNGPMGTFDSKVRMGVVLGLYGEQTRKNLDIIRTIRNAFAHSTIPITFKTPEIEKLCSCLQPQFVLFPKAVRVEDGKIVNAAMPTEARERFIKACATITHNLSINAAHCSQRPRRHKAFGEYEVWLKLPALP